MKSEASANGDPQRSVQATRRIGLLAIALFIAWFFVGLVLLQAIRPSGPLTFGARRGWANAFAGEYWAFFTRDPSVPEPIVFRRDSHMRWVRATAFPYGTLTNWFGWKRKGRSEGFDLDMSLYRIPANAWRACPDANPRCLDSLGPPIEVDLLKPVLCGHLALMRVSPIPWEIAMRRHSHQNADAVLVTVPCRR